MKKSADARLITFNPDVETWEEFKKRSELLLCQTNKKAANQVAAFLF
ncbi:MAG: hypothetical protein ACR2G5_11020 [Pyrinomonadaceae bacterium]